MEEQIQTLSGHVVLVFLLAVANILALIWVYGQVYGVQLANKRIEEELKRLASRVEQPDFDSDDTISLSGPSIFLPEDEPIKVDDCGFSDFVSDCRAKLFEAVGESMKLTSHADLLMAITRIVKNLENAEERIKVLESRNSVMSQIAMGKYQDQELALRYLALATEQHLVSGRYRKLLSELRGFFSNLTVVNGPTHSGVAWTGNPGTHPLLAKIATTLIYIPDRREVKEVVKAFSLAFNKDAPSEGRLDDNTTPV